MYTYKCLVKTVVWNQNKILGKSPEKLEHRHILKNKNTPTNQKETLIPRFEDIILSISLTGKKQYFLVQFVNFPKLM